MRVKRVVILLPLPKNPSAFADGFFKFPLLSLLPIHYYLVLLWLNHRGLNCFLSSEFKSCLVCFLACSLCFSCKIFHGTWSIVSTQVLEFEHQFRIRFHPFSTIPSATSSKKHQLISPILSISAIESNSTRIFFNSRRYFFAQN